MENMEKEWETILEKAKKVSRCNGTTDQIPVKVSFPKPSSYQPYVDI